VPSLRCSRGCLFKRLRLEVGDADISAVEARWTWGNAFAAKGLMVPLW
jgi:hypothetical protein